MKIALYGMPCAGKTTVMEKIKNARIISGSCVLNQICGGDFSALSDGEKNAIRVRYTEYVRSLNDELIVSDGHYSFLENIVFTDSDGDLYDVFMYVYCRPETLLQRYRESEKNQRFADNTTATLEQWQRFEIDRLRSECHKRNKDFYVVSDKESDDTRILDFLEYIRNGHSCYRLAAEICERIRTIYPAPCSLFIIDGDKTAIEQDSFRYCCNGKTSVFDGNFYTDYQAYLFMQELYPLPEECYKRIRGIRKNEWIWSEIGSSDYIVLSSGITELWEKIGLSFDIRNIIANPMISADTKYYVVKLLQQQGYIIHAYGDSKIDLFMLKQADSGTLYIGNRISRSLKGESLHGLHLIYDHRLCKLSDLSDPEISEDIAICKSNSGINGYKLAAAHLRLGSRLGRAMSETLPEKDTAVLVLERGGRFFGDGLYASFGGTFYAINPSRDAVPNMAADRVIIVDSVINTGRAIQKVITEIRSSRPDMDIVIASNVIQEDAVKLFEGLKVYTIRTTANSFVGRNQAKQTGKIGPDTADRLFNLIEKRF